MERIKTTAEIFEEMGSGAAKEIGVGPTRIEYIEARGFLCHELLYLLDGRIEFIFAPWWRLFNRLGDFFWGVFPVCRWYPPDESILEWVGHHPQCETKVYRLTITQDDQVVFTVEYRPGTPMGLPGGFPYNVPQLRSDQFLRPPFEETREIISTHLKESIERREQWLEPLLNEEGLSDSKKDRNAMNKAWWEVFVEMQSKDEREGKGNHETF